MAQWSSSTYPHKRREMCLELHYGWRWNGLSSPPHTREAASIVQQQGVKLKSKSPKVTLWPLAVVHPNSQVPLLSLSITQMIPPCPHHHHPPLDADNSSLSATSSLLLQWCPFNVTLAHSMTDGIRWEHNSILKSSLLAMILLIRLFAPAY